MVEFRYMYMTPGMGLLQMEAVIAHNKAVEAGMKIVNQKSARIRELECQCKALVEITLDQTFQIEELKGEVDYKWQ